MQTNKSMKWFTNRDREMKRFISWLNSDTKQILAVIGESGIGKSFLIDRMIIECNERNLSVVRVDLDSIHSNGYMDIINLATKILGFPEIQPEKQKININALFDSVMLQNMQASIAADVDVNKNYGSVTGVSVENLFNMNIDDANDKIRRQIEASRNFILQLADMPRHESILIFIDNIDKASSSTTEWISKGLLKEISAGNMPCIKVVLCGIDAPELDSQIKFNVEMIQLQPFKQEHVEAYLEVRGIPHSSKRDIALAFRAAGKKTPLELALATDLFIALRAEDVNES